MDFYIKGDTYLHREELKSWGCYWQPEKKAWRIEGIAKNGLEYNTIKNLNLELEPVLDAKSIKAVQDRMLGIKL